MVREYTIVLVRTATIEATLNMRIPTWRPVVIDFFATAETSSPKMTGRHFTGSPVKLVSYPFGERDERNY